MKLYRFYFADGRVERHTASRAPWSLRDYAPAPGWTADDGPAPCMRRTFRMVRYEYGPDFVGPHRDADFHEVA